MQIIVSRKDRDGKSDGKNQFLPLRKRDFFWKKHYRFYEKEIFFGKNIIVLIVRLHTRLSNVNAHLILRLFTS